MTLRPLLDIATESPRFRALAKAAAERARQPGEPVPAYVSAAIRPYLLAALIDDEGGLGGAPALVVTADDRSARDLAADLRAFLAPRRVRYYPSRGTSYESHVAPPPHLVGLRIAALDSLLRSEGQRGIGPRRNGTHLDAASSRRERTESAEPGGVSPAARSEPAEPDTVSPAAADPPVVVASATALAEKVPDAELRPEGFAIAVGEEIDLGDVAHRLVECGYERVDQVEDRGQFAVRGGILDAYPATEERAVRVELFGDEVESLRWFSTFTQRSLGDADRVELAPAAELALEHRELGEIAADSERDERPDVAELLPVERFGAVLDLLPDEAVAVIAAEEEIEPALRDHWEDVTAAMHADDARSLYVDVARPLRGRAALAVSAQDSGQEHSFRAQRVESPARTPREAEAELEKLVRSGYRAIVCFERRGEAERARYNLDRIDAPFLEGRLPEEPAVRFAEASVREGFLSPELKLAAVPWRRLLHRRRDAAPAPARGRLATFTDLRVGDHVVHADHGIARFAGFDTKTVGGVTRDYLYLEYRGDDRVFVPSDQMAKVSRYVGADGHAPSLSALGSRRWESMKARARRAAGELAGELINLYAERRIRSGHGFAPDGEWQLGFEAAFPYRETADQLEAIEEVKADMEAPRPMDRLICGDVGYGKTEVALRATMKAASEGKQVMMLVPTTILAQQHFGTFRERLADFPFVVEMVSRLRRPADTRRVLRDFTEGRVDVLIGTHRLLSRDVRARELGLLIVDEEQRFGVKQKELLRQLKLKVDVLSLSATPIPRTLQMSLAGLRDISIVETPPEGRRPVRTFVGPYDEELVRRAIERETARGGQTFYLHNRIETLHEIAESLRALCPGVRFGEAHGQMAERDLEETMLSFLRGDADCLVATTIIESGLDIPTANTLIVERADHLGLAQAYQIRGRVGRSAERAYAYLLYPSAASLTAEAAARLATLSDYTELGSGFRIAMRDLDIRGAGNLLGEEQSGHVAAVGFELYCQMLDDAVQTLRDGDGAAPRERPEELVRLDVDVDAYVPAQYVPYEAAKIDVHRRIAAARDRGDLAALRDELEDRFGPVPEPVEHLLALQRARLDLGRVGARSVDLRGGVLGVAPVDLDSDQVEALREGVPASYDLRTRTLTVRVPNEPAARLAAVASTAAALLDLVGTPIAA
jgi:transcription-repair coupling factor (superfamily II helicase)